jgi:hypothetical protein
MEFVAVLDFLGMKEICLFIKRDTQGLMAFS